MHITYTCAYIIHACRSTHTLMCITSPAQQGLVEPSDTSDLGFLWWRGRGILRKKREENLRSLPQPDLLVPLPAAVALARSPVFPQPARVSNVLLWFPFFLIYGSHTLFLYFFFFFLVSPRLVLGWKKPQPVLVCHFDGHQKSPLRPKEYIHLAFFFGLLCDTCPHSEDILE